MEKMRCWLTKVSFSPNRISCKLRSGQLEAIDIKLRDITARVLAWLKCSCLNFRRTSHDRDCKIPRNLIRLYRHLANVGIVSPVNWVTFNCQMHSWCVPKRSDPVEKATGFKASCPSLINVIKALLFQFRNVTSFRDDADRQYPSKRRRVVKRERNSRNNRALHFLQNRVVKCTRWKHTWKCDQIKSEVKRYDHINEISYRFLSGDMRARCENTQTNASVSQIKKSHIRFFSHISHMLSSYYYISVKRETQRSIWKEMNAPVNFRWNACSFGRVYCRGSCIFPFFYFSPNEWQVIKSQLKARS